MEGSVRGLISCNAAVFCPHAVASGLGFETVTPRIRSKNAKLGQARFGTVLDDVLKIAHSGTWHGSLRAACVGFS